MPFRFVDDIATADCAVEIEAKTLPSLFVDSAMSLTACMTDPSLVRSELLWKVNLEEDNLGRLLYAWLSELVYIRDAENVLLSEFEIDKLETDGRWCLGATVRGERIDHDRHDITVDVKAITMHMFRIEKQGDVWKAFVIFDL